MVLDAQEARKHLKIANYLNEKLSTQTKVVFRWGEKVRGKNVQIDKAT